MGKCDECGNDVSKLFAYSTDGVERQLCVECLEEKSLQDILCPNCRAQVKIKDSQVSFTLKKNKDGNEGGHTSSSAGMPQMSYPLYG